MAPVGGEENRYGNNFRKENLNVDSKDFATQQFDSQFSPGDDVEGNGADDFLYLTDTMPSDDYLLEDAYETQLANLHWETPVVDFAEETQVVGLADETQVVGLADETQVVDLAEETQVVDFADETQVVDFAEESQFMDLAGETQVLDDIDCMKSKPIEFSNELNAEVAAVSECEETNTTDIMCDTQQLSPDGSVKNDGSDSVGVKSTAEKDPFSEGLIYGGFTSIRAASIRASGLAAHARRANNSFCTTTSDKSSLGKEICEQKDSSVANNNNKSEVLRKSNIVRQLFREDEDVEVGGSETNIVQTDDNLDVPEQLDSENCLAGLSYANSQEPGELSQAHALEVVDKFLDLNFMEYDESLGMRVHKAEKPKVVSSAAKGPRDLAKSSVLKSTDGNCGVYDWDDTREDDGGGDFFVKKKEFFFEKRGSKQRCLPEPKKSGDPVPRNVKRVEKSGDEKDRKFAKNKLDSGLMLRKLRSKGKPLHSEEELPQKNFVKDLDEQLNMASGPKLAENAGNDVSDMGNIGPDTQIAAEAMEILCFEMHVADSSNGGPDKGVHKDHNTGKEENRLRKKTAFSEKSKILCPDRVGVVTRQAKRTKRISIGASNEFSVSPKQCKKGTKKRGRVADVNVCADHVTRSTGQMSVSKDEVGDRLDFYVPVAHRTRKSSGLKHAEVTANSLDGGDELNDAISARVHGKRTASRDKNAETVTTEKVRKVGSSGFKQSKETCVDTSCGSNIDLLDDLRGGRHIKRLKRSGDVAASIPVNAERDNLNNSSSRKDPAMPCLDTQFKKLISHRTVMTRSARNVTDQCDSDNLNDKTTLNHAVGASASKQGREKNDDGISVEAVERTGRKEGSPRGGRSSSHCGTPSNCTEPVNDASPICMGDEYHKQSCRKNLSTSLLKELDDLLTGSPVQFSGTRESRKRKDFTTVRVLFSQHLEVDVVKQQKKVLTRLGGGVASSMSDATHFVADEFVRTRNMLEAISYGKPVVNPSWIESCGQARCLIDEKKYILRDAKKEKEFGFCLPISLERACQHPLLQGQKVLITPNTKPGKAILANLVKAVQGLAVERLGRSVMDATKLPDDLLILSCEEDYEACVPFLEKGGDVYSSELLLNGIVKQRLEYERHRLFVDHVRRTRSTVWVKKKRVLPLIN